MKKIYLTILSIAFLVFVSSTSAQAQTFEGRAAAVRASVTAVGQPVVATGVSDTGFLPAEGGGTSLTGVGVTVAGAVSVGANGASTSGNGSMSSSSANVADLSINLPGLTVSAPVVQSFAQATCPSGTDGNSTIADLNINGTPVVISGSPNQTIPIAIGGTSVGELIINEQIQEMNSLTVNALHLQVTLLDLTTADVVISSSRAGINCATAPGITMYDGQASGLWVIQKNNLYAISTYLSDTGHIGGTGGDTSSSVAGANLLGGLVTTGVVSSASSGGDPAGTPNETRSNAAVDDLAINVAGIVSISAGVVRSDTACTCSTVTPTCTAGSSLASLSYRLPLGTTVTIPITGSPNQTVVIPPVGTIIINERSTNAIGVHGYAQATALHISLNPLGLLENEFRIANSMSGITCGLRPSASGVTVGGRALTPAHIPIAGAKIALVDQNGVRKYAVSNAFGYYQFENVEAGQAYTIGAKSRNYWFQSQVVNVGQQVTDLDLFGLLLSSKFQPEQSLDIKTKADR